jgi:hypothetical protein
VAVLRAAVASCEHAYALVRAHGEIMMSEPAPFHEQAAQVFAQ